VNGLNIEWIDSPLWLAVNALVAYRLTRLWVSDMLPPLPRVRMWIEDRSSAMWGPNRRKAAMLEQDPVGRYSDYPGGERQREADELTRNLYAHTPPIAYMVTCPWCSGFWISLVVALLASLIPLAVWAIPAVALAFSAVVGLLASITDDD
jgi:hypothetical protein